MIKRPRPFQRDAYLGLRIPSDDRRRLVALCAARRRDMSSLALEFIVKGILQAERDSQPEQQVNT